MPHKNNCQGFYQKLVYYCHRQVRFVNKETANREKKIYNYHFYSNLKCNFEWLKNKFDETVPQFHVLQISLVLF